MTRTRHASLAALGRIAAAGAARLLAVVAVLAVLAASVVTPSVVTPSLAGASSRNPALGVYAGAADPPAAQTFSATLGAQPPFAMDFLDGSTWRTITQKWPYSHWKGKGYTMIWGVNMLPDTYKPNTDPSQSGGSCYGLTRGASGAFDHYFTTVATNIVQAGFPISVIRFGWEFNGNWFPWAAQGCASAFVRYWDHIVATMRAVPGAHFTFEWNPTRGDLGVGNLAQYYPGNKVRGRSRSGRLRPGARSLPRSADRVPTHAHPEIRAELGGHLRCRAPQDHGHPRMGPWLGDVQRQRATRSRLWATRSAAATTARGSR